MVRQQHRLGSLQVRVARQIGRAGRDRTLEQHLLKAEHSIRNDAQLPLAPQPQRGRHLVVAAASGVELPAGRAGDLGDAALDGRVDVLVGGREHERAAVQLVGHRVERGQDLRRLVAVEQPGADEPAHVRARADDVVGRQAHVERQRGREREQLVGRTRPEPSVPEGHRSVVPP